MVLQTTVGVPKIEDYLSDLKKRDRHQLSDFIKQLQYTLYDAICHLGNADVSIVTATTIRTIHTLLHEAISGPSHVYERTTNTIRYVIKSLQKQNIRLLSDKSRQDSTLRVVSILVAQQDAASNILLATSMKQDSTRMNAIAALTMVSPQDIYSSEYQTIRFLPSLRNCHDLGSLC